MPLKPRTTDQRAIVGDPDARIFSTNIDRRTCTRVVPMRVLALGLSRTGTSSIRQALLDLGYNDCYHYASILNENPRDADMWVEALEAKYEGKGKPFVRARWDQLLGHCMAITDTPCVAFYRELLDAYPEAKVILSVRDSTEQWYKSQMGTIIPFFEMFYGSPSSLRACLYRYLLPQTSVDQMNKLLLKHYMYRDLATNGKVSYERHIEEIQRLVPSNNLLIYNVKQGWEPICKFLGNEKPEHPFPRVNDTANFQQNGGKMQQVLDQVIFLKLAKMVSMVGMVAVVLLAFCMSIF